MVEGRGAKRVRVAISSSSSSSSEEEYESQYESESEEVDDDLHGDNGVVEISSSSSRDTDDDDGSDLSDTDDQEYGQSESSGCENLDDFDTESICSRITRLLHEGNDLQEELNLTSIRAYLRKHELRISGTKAECIHRIEEHWRLKDGRGEVLYPRSSFTLNCTGDVCRGDIVLFSQKVYGNFIKMKKSGRLIGKRTIAGRIVKESYGAAKQQHTFTVEVLWNKGIKKLPPLFPLLVKGRNLYRLMTFRQPWKNETERSEVLAEKHKRGADARLMKALKKNIAMKKNNRAFSMDAAGSKQQKQLHETGPSQIKRKSDLVKGRAKSGDRQGKSTSMRRKHTFCGRPPPIRQVNLNQATTSRGAKSCRGRENISSHYKDARHPPFHPYTHPPESRHFDHGVQQRARFPNYSHDAAAAAPYPMRLPLFGPYVDAAFMPASDRPLFVRDTHPQHTTSHHLSESRPRGCNPFPWYR